jgi:glycerophosphoryl diester phosphodiesterase
MKLRLLATLATGCAIALAAAWMVYQDKPEGNNRAPLPTVIPNIDIKFIGHRGAAHYAPENTLPSIAKAVELGFDYIELDVRFTRDGVPVLMHDKTIDRTTNGSGDIASLTLDEVKQLDAGSWFADEFAGTTVPTLREALELIDGQACVFWDAKATVQSSATKLFKEFASDSECLVIRFREEYAGTLFTDWPDAPVSTQYKGNGPEEIERLLQKYPGYRGLSVMRFKITRELVAEAHAKGLPVFTRLLWGQEKVVRYPCFVYHGVDALMIGNIVRFREYLSSIDPAYPPSPSSIDCKKLRRDI